MTREEAIKAVKVRIDEVTPASAGLAVFPGELVKPVDEYIEKLLDRATDTVRLLAPLDKLELSNLSGEFTLETLTSGVKYRYKDHPSDFLRIGYLRFSDWERDVSQATPIDSELYRMQRNPNTTAGSSKPVVAIVGNKIEAYGVKDASVTPTVGKYVADWKFDTTNKLINELVADAIFWQCALLVLSIMGRTEAAKQAQQFFVESLQKLGI